MKTNFLLIISLTVLIFSCGPSKEKIEQRKKFVADSIASVKEQKEKERIHLEKIEVGKSINKTNLTKILDQLNSQLLIEKRELNRINEFQFGRSQSTKQEELYEQNMKINELEYFITNVEKEFSLSNLFNSFDFQLTPEGTVKHIFSAANNSDFSKMRHLLDPYGEYESDAQEICLIEMMPLEIQNEWKQTFAKGRIIGEPIIKDDMAEIEIAIGYSSNQLEIIKLVQRMDKWYISGM